MAAGIVAKTNFTMNLTNAQNGTSKSTTETCFGLERESASFPSCPHFPDTGLRASQATNAAAIA